jgi:hypothetical protein
MDLKNSEAKDLFRYSHLEADLGDGSLMPTHILLSAFKSLCYFVMYVHM